MANIFCPRHLRSELAKTHETIRVVVLAADGGGSYPQPVPDLLALERYERELHERLRLATFPGARTA